MELRLDPRTPKHLTSQSRNKDGLLRLRRLGDSGSGEGNGPPAPEAQPLSSTLPGPAVLGLVKTLFGKSFFKRKPKLPSPASNFYYIFYPFIQEISTELLTVFQ